MISNHFRHTRSSALLNRWRCMCLDQASSFLMTDRTARAKQHMMARSIRAMQQFGLPALRATHCMSERLAFDQQHRVIIDRGDVDLLLLGCVRTERQAESLIDIELSVAKPVELAPDIVLELHTMAFRLAQPGLCLERRLARAARATNRMVVEAMICRPPALVHNRKRHKSLRSTAGQRPLAIGSATETFASQLNERQRAHCRPQVLGNL